MSPGDYTAINSCLTKKCGCLEENYTLKVVIRGCLTMAFALGLYITLREAYENKRQRGKKFINENEKRFQESIDRIY